MTHLQKQKAYCYQWHGRMSNIFSTQDRGGGGNPEIFNSLHLGKSKKFSILSLKTEIKTTDVKPICCKSNKDNNTSKYSNKSDNNIKCNNSNRDPSVTPRVIWKILCCTQHLESANAMFEYIYSFSPTSSMFEMNRIKGKQTP